jgi:DNA-binding GntR family transcriptional regulator
MPSPKAPPGNNRQLKSSVVRTDIPRYIQIADELKKAITLGIYPINSQLPTEYELCETLNVSRFTVREAIRILSTQGLVHRRPRSGTIVSALPDETRYTQGVNSIRDLFQYAQNTVFDYSYIGKIKLSKENAITLASNTGQEWIYAIAQRKEKEGKKSIGITRLFLNPQLTGIEKLLRKSKDAIYVLIEKEFKLKIDRVEQEIEAVGLDTDDAAMLEAQVNSPALRITRKYFDQTGRLIEYANNIHPADRFTYKMLLNR